jgi:hypothetical protein
MSKDYKYFHVRRITDAIYGMSSPANDHGGDGGSTFGYLLTTDSTREKRLNEILDSLHELHLMTFEELNAARDAVAKVQCPSNVTFEIHKVGDCKCTVKCCPFRRE